MQWIDDLDRNNKQIILTWAIGQFFDLVNPLVEKDEGQKEAIFYAKLLMAKLYPEQSHS